MMPKFPNIFRDTIIPSVLNSYSVVFFFNNRLMGLVLLSATFFNFQAGLSGFIAVVITVAVAKSMGLDESRFRQGIFSFNALLTGIGMGTFFEAGPAFFLLLLLAVIFSLIFSVVLSGWLGKYGLPFLSIPFVASFWLILLPSGQFTHLGLTQRNIFWMNEMYSIGGKTLLDFFQTIENLPLNRMVAVYLRSLSSIIFQDNLMTGILIAAALLFSSRIAFLLSITGFLSAYIFAHIVGSDMAGFSFYNVGANYILVAIAAGGFFVIPSVYSFLWVVILIPMTSVLILFMSALMPVFHVPFFSLPFSAIIILFLYFLVLRVKPGKLILTPYQYYSPEINLYTYIGNSGRLTGTMVFPLHLPFWGEWTVNQGYDGKYTHKGEWGKALDFVLTDEAKRTFSGSGNECGDFYCYNKPVLAPADGIIAEIIDHVEDNEPGKVNSTMNWGNTIVIRHLNNLYTQMSHLRPGTFRFKTGDFVRQGDIVALCGNSGRSPAPHLHFQVQSTPLTGSRTIDYPVSYYTVSNGSGTELKSYSVPSLDEKVSNVIPSGLLKKAFDLQPGMILNFRYRFNNEVSREISWEVFTDSYNNRYIYCAQSRSTAFFVNDGTMFYFTSFYGNRKSLLYFFYLGAYKVLLANHETIKISDRFPLHIVAGNTFIRYLHDFAAPFYQFIMAEYSSNTVWSDSPVNPSQARLSSDIHISYFSSVRNSGSSVILLAESRINEFSYDSQRTKVWAQRLNI